MVRKIKVGQVAPDFTLPTMTGEEVTLSELSGKKVLLSFHRYASCPYCDLRMSQVKRDYEALKKSNVEVLSVFHSPIETLQKYIGEEYPFPVLSDPEKIVYEKYEVGWSILGWCVSNCCCPCKLAAAWCKGFTPGHADGNSFMLPADFLIDERGIVREAFYSRMIDEHMPWQWVEKFAAEPDARKIADEDDRGDVDDQENDNSAEANRVDKQVTSFESPM